MVFIKQISFITQGCIIRVGIEWCLACRVSTRLKPGIHAVIGRIDQMYKGEWCFYQTCRSLIDMRHLAHGWCIKSDSDAARRGPRGKGIGRKLLAQALALAESVPGLLQVNLSVNANNPAAISLYESLGFQTFGREPGAMKIGNSLYDELHMCWHPNEASPSLERPLAPDSLIL